VTPLLTLLGIPVLLALTSMWRGYVLMVLWRWFIVPAFHLPPLTLTLAIGLSLIVGYLTHQAPTTKDESPAFGRSVLLALIFPAIALLVGWLVTLFM
jgi:cytochrome bd-type quinol oxidase subunit 1